MSYRIAGIDIHKRMLAVVVSDVEVDSEFHFERRKFSSSPEQLRSLAAWLLEQEAEEVVMAMRVRRDRYPYESRIEGGQLFAASQMLSEIIGVPVQPNKAVTGRNAFAHEAGIP